MSNRETISQAVAMVCKAVVLAARGAVGGELRLEARATEVANLVRRPDAHGCDGNRGAGVSIDDAADQGDGEGLSDRALGQGGGGQAGGYGPHPPAPFRPPYTPKLGGTGGGEGGTGWCLQEDGSPDDGGQDGQK